MPITEMGVKRPQQQLTFDKNGANKNILTAWQKLNKDGYAPIVGKGGDAGLADFSAGKSAITLGSTASLKQILQDVNGKFEVELHIFRRYLQVMKAEYPSVELLCGH